MINKVVPHLFTYPRSGSHYFDDMLYEEEKIHFSKSHYLDELFDKDNNKIRTIITIARDPIDSISSYIGLYHSFNLESITHEHIFQEKITEYILYYSFLCEHADYVIDFDDLVSSPESVIKKLLSLLNIDKNKYNLFERDIILKYKDYIPSSKSLVNYKKSMLNNFDLNLCYYYYNKLLEKKIII